MILWTSPAAFVFRISPTENVCKAREFGIISPHFYYNIRPQFGTIVHGIIPISSVFLFTLVTIVKLRLTRYKQAKQSQNSEALVRQSRRDMEITRQMIVVCSIFVAFSLTFAICARFVLTAERTTFEKERFFNVNLAILFLCQSVINSANFYMYVIFGQKFRSSFIGLLGMKKYASRTKKETKATTDHSARCK